MISIEVDVPCGVSGDWRVEEFSVSDFDSRMSYIRSARRGVPSGDYKRLMRGGMVVMSNTKAEIIDHLEFIRQAKEGGHILINGLGLGVALKEILTSDKVESVTVIENSKDVINLVAEYFSDPRVQIINADAYEWQPPKGKRYSVVWHDIWDSICADNLPEMTKLHRKYGRRTDWQGSWCKSECMRYR